LGEPLMLKQDANAL